MILNLEKSCNNSLEKSYTLFILFSLMFINLKIILKIEIFLN